MTADRIFWILTAAVWCCALLPCAAYFWATGERRRAGVILLFGLVGGGPSILGHLASLQ